VNGLCISRGEISSSLPRDSIDRERLRTVAAIVNTTGAVAEITPPTERGEALMSSSSQELPNETIDAWYAIWTRSHCERLVTDQLAAKGFSTFLPEMGTWSKRQGQLHVVPMPMFPGYLFVRQRMDKYAYVEMLKVRGLVRILEDGWNRLTPIADDEVSAVQRLVEAQVPVFPHGPMLEGDRVRVTEGPLKDVEGTFIEDRPGCGRLVVSIGLLGRGVAIEVDGTSVKPCPRN
jgi:transcription antitermination factor NusG